jgi:hypothetical protein
VRQYPKSKSSKEKAEKENEKIPERMPINITNTILKEIKS